MEPDRITFRARSGPGDDSFMRTTAGAAAERDDSCLAKNGLGPVPNGQGASWTTTAPLA